MLIRLDILHRTNKKKLSSIYFNLTLLRKAGDMLSIFRSGIYCKTSP